MHVICFRVADIMLQSGNRSDPFRRFQAWDQEDTYACNHTTQSHNCECEVESSPWHLPWMHAWKACVPSVRHILFQGSFCWAWSKYWEKQAPWETLFVSWPTTNKDISSRDKHQNLDHDAFTFDELSSAMRASSPSIPARTHNKPGISLFLTSFFENSPFRKEVCMDLLCTEEMIANLHRSWVASWISESLPA